MAPRLSRVSHSWQTNGGLKACCALMGSAPATSIVTSPFAAVSHASTVAQRRKHRDPYAIAQAKARKAANISRQAVLQQERKAALGDPVRGITTPLVESFDTAGLTPEWKSDAEKNWLASKTADSSSTGDSLPDRHINFFLTDSELDNSLRRSDWLTLKPTDTTHVGLDGRSPKEEQADKVEQKNTAEEALRRISSLSLGTSKDRLRANKQRCIDIFGRHNTDQYLGQRPGSRTSRQNDEETTPARVGPDTGSSEVQIAILTAKIRSLADFLGDRGGKDKNNKRNLRLLVHRRAKLLKYLREKERGGPRWRNLVESLGLTEGTWKGEISL